MPWCPIQYDGNIPGYRNSRYKDILMKIPMLETRRICVEAMLFLLCIEMMKLSNYVFVIWCVHIIFQHEINIK